MGKGASFLPKKWWTRSVLLGFSSPIIFDFIARKQYGVPNFRDPNVMWPWWLEQQAKIRSGEIPAGTPGYALCAWRNEAEERYMETLDEYLELVAERGTSPHGH
jgi:hypothetical protein